MNIKTMPQAQTFYRENIVEPHGLVFAETVDRFQHGFLTDCKGLTVEDAFIRAVSSAARLIAVIKIKASNK